MSDTISDFITIIRNAYLARKEYCTGKHTILHLRIATILKEKGYIRNVEEITDNNRKLLKITLKYIDETPAITGLNRHSSPGRRLYYSFDKVPRVLGGLGVAILTTSKGVLTDYDARREKVGGEMICSVW